MIVQKLMNRLRWTSKDTVCYLEAYRIKYPKTQNDALCNYADFYRRQNTPR